MTDTPHQNDNDLLAIHISESMNLRNQLRSGLLEAQRQDTGKIPVLVSWPPWLEDGVVCMFAGDFVEIIRRAIRETAMDIGDIDPSAVDPSLFEPVRRTVMNDSVLDRSGAAPEPSIADTVADPVDSESGFTEVPLEAMHEKPSEPSPEVPDEEPAARKTSAQSLADDLFATLKNKQK